MSEQSKRQAGILLVILPTVSIGGVSLLTMLIDPNSDYMKNPLRQDLFRAGHAHAGVMLVLSLLILRYVDEANMSNGAKSFVRIGVPFVAILLPLAFFFSVLDPHASEPNAFIYLAYAGFAVLTVTLVTRSLGLLRK